MNRSRRACSPSMGYEPRLINTNRQVDATKTPSTPSQIAATDYADESGSPGAVFEPPGHNFIDHPHAQQQQYPLAYRDRLPATYRATLREPYPSPNSGGSITAASTSATYKILCVTNINHKISDQAIKEALSSDFSRFGDISVSICHDSGERLAYIYFRTHEEAREARHIKSRTILFDRAIEIEPIYEPKLSPSDSPPPQTAQQASGSSSSSLYPHRRSVTPPDYYGTTNSPARRLLPNPATSHRIMESSSPPTTTQAYSHPPRGYVPIDSEPPMSHMTQYGSRYYMAHSHMQPPSPYSSPPPEAYARSYHPFAQPQPVPPQPIHAHHQIHTSHHVGPPGYPYHSPYEHPVLYETRDPRSLHDAHLERSPRHDAYYPPTLDHRVYSAGPAGRPISMLHPSSAHPHQYHPDSLPVHHSSSTSIPISRRSPPIHHSHPPNATIQHSNPPVNTSASSTATGHLGPSYPEPARFMSREYRREKYGRDGYNCEVDESKPSRLIFVTNIDPSKSEDDLRNIFTTFGIMEELDMRKVRPEFSSALIKFSSMDCAYKAKTAINGRYIGSTKCRISYGKVSASRRLWIGGFGPSTTSSLLEQEFGRYGDIIGMDYTSGRPYAYIEFETANQAQFATLHSRGTFAANADRKIRIEYVDPTDRVVEKPVGLDRLSNRYDGVVPKSESRSHIASTEHESDLSQPASSTARKRRSISPDNCIVHNTKRHNNVPADNSNSDKNHNNDNLPAGDGLSLNRTLTRKSTDSNLLLCTNHKQSELNNNSRSEIRATGNTRSNLNYSNSAGQESTISERESQSSLDETSLDNSRALSTCASIKDIVDSCQISWICQLVLRNFKFPSTMYMVSGSTAVIEKYITKLGVGESTNQCPMLSIRQRWRLHPQPKLEEVKRRMQNGSLAMIVITPRYDNSTPKTPQSFQQFNEQEESECIKNKEENCEGPDGIKNSEERNDEPNDTESSSSQARPLKNLISYLEQKDAAGVISLNPLDGEQETPIDGGGSKLLYTFPPGQFALNLLGKRVPGLLQESIKEEFLLGVIVSVAY